VTNGIHDPLQTRAHRNLLLIVSHFDTTSTALNMTNESDAAKLEGKDSAVAVSSTTTSILPSNDILDERLIDAEYKIWKKNTPYLYDFVLTHSLEWPSLTCQWLPTVRSTKNNKTTIEHQLLLGTHTTDDEPNYLMIATCLLPYDDRIVSSTSATTTETATTAEATTTAPSTNKENGTTSDKNNNNSSSSSSNKKAAATTTAPTTVASLRYDEDKKEVGGYGLAGTGIGKIEIKMKIPHEGEVNR
jgi:histone-binding protein RBBP4